MTGILAGPQRDVAGRQARLAYRTGSQRSIEIEDAPLYKALHRLGRARCVEAEWGLSENNRRARYYRLTPRGRQRLQAEESAWRLYAAAVFPVLEPA